MNHQWRAEDNSYSAADSFCGKQTAEALLEVASPSRLGDQIRDLLGDDCELEASFLEERWASGRPMASVVCPREREQAMGNDERVTFAELNTLGSFFFSPRTGLTGDHPAYPANSATSYAAAWLRDPLEMFASRTEDQAPEQESSGFKGHADETRILGLMTHRRACELLGVSEDSTATQIRAAYRRMVSEWHPDRLEQSGEKVRAFATRQMAAINEAYHLLRDLSPVARC